MDVLSIVEAAYDTDSSEDDWYSRLAAVILENAPRPLLGVVVNGYDISDPLHPKLSENSHCAAPDHSRFLRGWGELVEIYQADPERTRASYGTLDEGLGLEVPVEAGRERLADIFASLGIGDVYGVNARNPSGRGLFAGLVLAPGFAPLAPALRRTFARIARHLAAAHRLRARLSATKRIAPEDADAVLTVDGKVENAVGAAREDHARASLREAAVALSRVRRTGRANPDLALAKWKALVDARWSLLDHFDRDGSHYLIAHRNDCQPAPMALLTDRERQVVALAAMGFANKAIAYELGIATSTVGVLVARALKRLGLKSRRDLLYNPVSK